MRLYFRSLASFGAILMLISLPSDLFYQQLLSYPLVWTPETIVTSPAPTIPRTTVYSGSVQYQSNNGTTLDADRQLTAAVASWFSSSGVMPELAPVNCPTSNCTWGPFQTLAVCSICVDNIFEYLTFGCFKEPGDWLPSSDAYASSPNITSCGYFLNATSDSPVLMTGYAIDPASSQPGAGLTMRIFPLTNALTRQRYYDGSLKFQNSGDSLVDFLVVGNQGSASLTYENATPIAYECSLSWCVNTIQSESYFGSLTENTTNSWRNETYRSYPWTVTPDTQQFYNHNISLTPPPVDGQARAEGSTTFGLSNTSMVATAFLLDEFAPSYLTVINASSPPNFRYNTLSPAGSDNVPMELNLWLSNTTEHVEKIAKVMSITIRNTISQNNFVETMSGIAWTLKPQVSTRWVWYTLPVILLVFSTLFLAATIIKTSKENPQVKIWKTSAIAILLNTLESDVLEFFGAECEMGEVQKKARDVKVKFG
jgi:hypothetical protein